jgi:hypothetical protein
MAANTGIVFSFSVTAHMEVTVGFSFAFGSFPEATVPRNPASGLPPLEAASSLWLDPI